MHDHLTAIRNHTVESFIRIASKVSGMITGASVALS